jgi:hypothetical protein
VNAKDRLKGVFLPKRGETKYVAALQLKISATRLYGWGMIMRAKFDSLEKVLFRFLNNNEDALNGYAEYAL